MLFRQLFHADSGTYTFLLADEARTMEAFVELMANLKLANPKHMDVAVQANLACGKPQTP